MNAWRCGALAASAVLAVALAGCPAPQIVAPSVSDAGAALPAPAEVFAQGLGHHHHPVSTRSADAQRAFDRGLTLCFAFNHDAARAFFRRAAELDPNLAMAHWGAAYALGSNYNQAADPAGEAAAWREIQKAQALSLGASESDRAYIGALAVRYSTDPNADRRTLALAYRDAMKKLAGRFTNDLDAATLYAESAMLLRPWQLWDRAGKPAEGTEELVATLESVLKRDANHIGANHFYIHAVEASANPERGLEAARRLPGLAPAAGHLVHMPAHIYSRLGDHAAAAAANEAGIVADEAFFKQCGEVGPYASMYYEHNLGFLVYSCAMQGRHDEALAAANKLAAHSARARHGMPMCGGTVITPMIVEARFGRWRKVLAFAEPGKDEIMAHAMWHFSRGLAYAADGDVARAQKESEDFLLDAKRVPDAGMPGMQNSDCDLLAIAQGLLDGRLAWARQNRPAAIAAFKKAVACEDSLNYMEPPDWWLTAREMLGKAYLLGGEAALAEATFRDDLARHPRSGRSLMGLMKSLEAQGKDQEVRAVQGQFEAAWKDADSLLDASSL